MFAEKCCESGKKRTINIVLVVPEPFHGSHDRTNSFREYEASQEQMLIPKMVNRMGPSNKSKRRALPANYIYKTADDVLRWRRAQDALKIQVTEEKIVPSDRLISKALMVWEDDGGAA